MHCLKPKIICSCQFFIAALFFSLIVGCSEKSGATQDVQEEQKVLDEQIENPWYIAGKQTVKDRKSIALNTNQAKNIILFIGDGMGISTVTAARIFDGQSRGESGEENMLSFERFPHVALVKTYTVDAQVADSAATASAMTTGVKTRFYSVGIWGDQPEEDCYGPQTDFPKTLAEIGESIGLSTGVVTTDKVTYATPAAVYAHSPSRLWEDDSRMSEEALKGGCIDIAQQLVGFPYGDGLDVVLGGGKESMLPKEQGGNRLDGKNLVEKWQQQNPGGTFVQSAKEFRALDNTNNADQNLLGLFASGHLSYAVDKNLDAEPTLAEMTSVAIDRLSQNPKGYFLMVENGHIDHANHQNNAYRVLSSAQIFSQAVETALSKVDLNDTLVLVTADHSHALTMVGYPKRGNPILGLVEPVSIRGGETLDGMSVDGDGNVYTTLGYRAGPGNPKAPVDGDNLQDIDFKQPAAIPMRGGLHSGEDVALYAIGPQSHLVGGVLEQNVIFHIMAEALGLNE